MAIIHFGNLTTDQMLCRLGISISEESRNELEMSRIDNAQDIPKGSWHCFDAPFKIRTGDDTTAKEIIGILSPYNDEMDTQLALESYGK